MAIKASTDIPYLPPQTVMDEIIDPVELEPLEEAQELDCAVNTPYGGHIVSLKTVKKLLEERNPLCPVCRGKITKGTPNPGVQRLVNAIIGKDKGDAHVTMMYKIINESCLRKKSRDAWNYPLTRSLYIHDEPIRESGQFVVAFRNKTENRTCPLVVELRKEIFRSTPSPTICYTFIGFFYTVDQMQEFNSELLKHQIETIEGRSRVNALTANNIKLDKLIALFEMFVRHNSFSPETEAVIADTFTWLNNDLIPTLQPAPKPVELLPSSTK